MPPRSSNDVPDERALDRIDALVGDYAGLRPERWVLTARVRERMQRTRLADVVAYADLIRGAGSAELDVLVEVLRVGETRFFRHASQLEAFRETSLKQLVRGVEKRRRLRAWSAGCATGEEAYTLLMLMVAAAPPGWDVSVVGTDISDTALEVARRGSYSAAALREVPGELRRRHFLRDGAGYRVRPETRARIRFDRHNLLSRPYPRPFDVISCRNVLIYFDEKTSQETTSRLVESLSPGGYLLFGHAESARKLGTLRGLEHCGPALYHRPDGNAAAPLPSGAPPAAAEVSVGSPVTAPKLQSPKLQSPKLQSPKLQSPKPLPPAGPLVVRPRGRDAAGSDLSVLLREALLHATTAIVVELDGCDELGDGAAVVLRRAQAAALQAGLGFTFRATRPGPRRWLRRHRLGVGE